MSRSGYSDDLDQAALNLWRANVDRSIRGARGQAFMRELLVALDAMPEKRLITEDLRDETGQVCTLGCIGVARGLPDEQMDNPYAHTRLAKAFGIARTLVQEIEYENDEGVYRTETPEERWVRMREWVASNVVGASAEEPPR